MYSNNVKLYITFIVWCRWWSNLCESLLLYSLKYKISTIDRHYFSSCRNTIKCFYIVKWLKIQLVSGRMPCLSIVCLHIHLHIKRWLWKGRNNAWCFIITFVPMVQLNKQRCYHQTVLHRLMCVVQTDVDLVLPAADFFHLLLTPFSLLPFDWSVHHL